MGGVKVKLSGWTDQLCDDPARLFAADVRSRIAILSGDDEYDEEEDDLDEGADEDDVDADEDYDEEDEGEFEIDVDKEEDYDHDGIADEDII